MEDNTLRFKKIKKRETANMTNIALQTNLIVVKWESKVNIVRIAIINHDLLLLTHRLEHVGLSC